MSAPLETPTGNTAAAAPDAIPTDGAAALWRLTNYVRPYVWAILLAVLLSLAFSAGRFGRAYLIKPIIDDVVTPSQQLNQAEDKLPFDLGLGGWFGGDDAAEEIGDEAAATPAAEPPAPEDDPDAEALAQARLAEREALRAKIQESLHNIILVVILIVLTMPVIMFGKAYTVSWVLGRMDLDMKVATCSKILALPLRFHQDRQRGDLITRMLSDVANCNAALRLIFDDFIESFVMLIAGAATLIYVSWKLSLIMLFIGPAIFLTISVFGKRIRKSARRRQEQVSDVTGRLLEILDGIKVVKAFRAEEYESQGFGHASHKLFRRGMKVVTNRVLARSLVDGLNNLAAIGVLILGVFLILRGRWGLTIGDLATFSAITVTLYPAVRHMAKGWVQLMDTLPSAERFFEVLDSPIEIDESLDAVTIPRVQESVRFEHVSFSYGREPVLRDVSFDAPAGQVVAIVGPTGSGKTTLIDLLLRFYDPDMGRIEIDGVDLREVSRESLLDQMAVVTQEPFLFDGTIRENIRYGRLDASDAEFDAAVRAAHVDEFIGALPEGFDTTVGASGSRLSGGQRQRITIARAILRDPAILLLDEATSSLDARSERLVQDAIDRLIPGRTVFVIAHRLSTVRAADQILVLEGGQITQRGTHENLIDSPGLYRDLVNLQQEDAGRSAEEPAPL